jgi:hypothetical protein
MSLQKYFLLKKNTFSIDPWSDSNVHFGSAQLSEQITLKLETDFNSPGGAPKFFVFGSFGSGKTHTLAHISHILQLGDRFKDTYPTEPIYLDVAPLSAKETWVRIHSRILDAIGVDRIKKAAEIFADSFLGPDKVDGFHDEIATFGDEALRVSQSNVFRNLLYGGGQASLSWNWMKGQQVTNDQSQTLGTQKSLSEPQEFVNCLLNVGSLYSKATGKKLVYLIDEAESFDAVTNPDSKAELQHSIRLLLEPHNDVSGLILGITAEGGQEDIGEFFQRDDIQRRVGYDSGLIDLNALVSLQPDAEQFVRQVIEHLVDSEKVAELAETEDIDSPDLFPFTEDGISAIAEQASTDIEKALPSAILRWMSDSAINAWRRRAGVKNHVLINRDIVEESIFPGS